MDLYDILLQKQVNGGGGGGSEPVIEPLSVTDNGEYSAPSGVDGYSPVTVNVPKGITPSGTIQITQNGTVDVTQYASADVNVSGGGGDHDVEILNAKMGHITVRFNKADGIAGSLLINVRNVYVSEGVTTIQSYLLYNGGKTLEFIDLPSTLTTIDTGAFDAVLKSSFTVVCRALTPPTNRGLSQGSSGTGTLYVPDESLNLYTSALGWKTYSSILPLSQYPSA